MLFFFFFNGPVRARLEAEATGKWFLLMCQVIFCQHPGTLVLNRLILVVTVHLAVR